MANNVTRVIDNQTITCKKKHIPDKDKCYSQWPQFPCYDENAKVCYDTNGDVQLLDPIADILYSIGTMYIESTRLLSQLIAGEIRRNPQNETTIRQFFHDYGTSIHPLSDKLLKSADNVRYYSNELIENNINNIIDVVKQKMPTTTTAITGQGGTRKKTKKYTNTKRHTKRKLRR